MAVCDAHYVFSLVNIGYFESNNDSGVLQNSAMGRALERNILGVPDAEPFEEIQDPLSYFLVGDDIFGLKTWMQRPVKIFLIIKESLITICQGHGEL